MVKLVECKLKKNETVIERYKSFFHLKLEVKLIESNSQLRIKLNFIAGNPWLFLVAPGRTHILNSTF